MDKDETWIFFLSRWSDERKSNQSSLVWWSWLGIVDDNDAIRFLMTMYTLK